MNVHWRLALIALTALALAGLATWLAWRTRAQARTDRANGEARDADFRAALRNLADRAQQLDRDLDTLTAAWIHVHGFDPFAPEGPPAVAQSTQEPRTPPGGHTDTPQPAPEAPRAPAHPPTPYPRTQTIAAVQAQQLEPRPEDIPTEAAPEVRTPGAHRATGR